MPSAACDEILDESFLLSSARGMLVRKAEWLASAMKSFGCQAFEWRDVLVRPFGQLALVHATIHQSASVGGRDWSGMFMLTDTWILRGDQWKVVSRHGTGPLPGSAS